MKNDQEIGIAQILNYIPEALLSNLSTTTNVDYYAKVLHGKKLFYLLLYGIIEEERLSQRSLEDIFNDPVFKLLFNLDKEESIRRSSISERLSKVDPGYFKNIYDCIYEQFSSLYPQTSQLKYNLTRVDSTIVSDTAGKLKNGIFNNNCTKNAVKFSVCFDGVLPSCVKIFTEPSYASEDLALPEVIMDHVQQEEGHNNIYVIDRGLQSSKNMKDFDEDKIDFICRIKVNRRYVEIESLIGEDQNLDFGDSILIKDSKINIYAGQSITNNKHHKKVLDVPFRLIIIQNKENPEKQFWFMTNRFDLPTKEITEAYRKRWDIEVFFRFIKQELNTSHLISLNKNGIQIMLYMTLIVSMLILIYKHANNIGYKTAKRRVKMEMRDLVISLIVVECGGNPNLFFNNT